MRKKINVLVRAIIQVKGKILVCKKINKDYYFFPGGHVEFGENTKEALAVRNYFPKEILNFGLKIEEI